MKAAVLHAEWVPKMDYVLTEDEKKTRRILDGSKVWRNPCLRLEDIEVPKIGPDEVLVRVKACGMCGSDVHMYEKDQNGYMLYPGYCGPIPVVPGHEFSGVIEKVGEKVRDFKKGDMVTAEEINWCGECEACKSGHVNQCERWDEIGFTYNGGFAECLKTKAKYCWNIGKLLDTYKSDEKAFEAGSLVEPTSVAYNGMFISAGGFRPGAHVVIYGMGPIGLACSALARAAGAGTIIGFEVVLGRMKFAQKLGVDYVFNPIELEEKGISPSEKVMEITEGIGAGLQVEAAGTPEITLPEMEKSLAIDGKILQIGRAPKATLISLENFLRRRAHVSGSFGHSGYGVFPSVIRLMAAKRIDMTQIITKRYKLESVLEAFEHATKRVDAKITVKP